MTPQATSELERRFGTKAAERWQHVLEHIRLSNDFSYLILLVPEASAARICAAELARHLRDQGQELESREFNTPEALREHLAPWVLRETGGRHPIWAASVTSEYDPQHAEWEAAWRYAVARINERRDELIKRHQAPIIMVGAPWLKTVLRESAPDWWSVRSMVVNLKPLFVPSDRKERNLEPVMKMLENDSSDALLDPDEVLEQADLLRGFAGQEKNLALLLERAFHGLRDRKRWVEAEEVSREILEIEIELKEPMLSIAGTYGNIGLSLLEQNRSDEAEEVLKKSLEIKKKNGDSLTSQGITLYNLANTLFDQDKLKEAEVAFRKALKLEEDGENSLKNRSIILDGLSRTLYEQGKLKEAEKTFRQALKLGEDGGDSLTHQGTMLHLLAIILHDQNKLEEAEITFRKALKLKEDGGDSLTSQGITASSLGRLLRDQGKLEKARELLFKALQLQEDGGDTQESLEITRTALINVLQKLERWTEAEALIRQSLKQTKDQLEANRGFRWHQLKNVLNAQGRTEEAQEAQEALKQVLTES